MRARSIGISLLLVAIWAGLALSQTVNPLPNPASATFPTALTDFLRKEPADRYNRMFPPFAPSGGTAPTSLTLTHTVAATEAFVHGYFVSQNATAMTYAANRRTYLYMDSVTTRSPELVASGGFGCTFKSRQSYLVAIECSTASSEPTLSVAGLLQLLYADTSGTAVTVVNRLAFKDPAGAMERTINVRSHGAIPNDGLDDYTAFADAVALAKEMGRGRIVIPPGEYTLSSVLLVSAVNDVMIEGLAGDPYATGAVRLIGTNPSQPVLRLLGSNRVTLKNVFVNHGVTADADIHAIEVIDNNQAVIEEVAIWPDFNATPTTGSYGGIRLSTESTSTFDTRIIRTKILNTRGNGITLVGQDNNRRISETFIEEVEMFNTAHAGGVYAGIHIGDHVTGVYVKNRTGISSSRNHSLHVQKSSVGPAPLDLFLDNVVFDAPVGTNIQIANASGVHISNSWISSPSVGGWAIDNASATSVGMEVWNSIIGSLFAGGIRYGGAHAKISGNHLNGFLAGQVGIHLTFESTQNYVDGNRAVFFLSAIVDDGTLNSFGLNQWGTDPRPLSNSGIAIGDSLFTLNKAGSNPAISFDPLDFLLYDRANNNFQFTIGNVVSMQVTNTGVRLPVVNIASGNPPTHGVHLTIREDLNVTGGAGADCALRARLANGTEVTVSVLVTDGVCP